MFAETDPLSRLISPEADNLSAEDWASVVIQLFPVNPTSGGIPPALDPAMIGICPSLRVAPPGNATTAVSIRPVGSPTVCMLSPVDWPVRYPNQAAAHWAVSQAYIQIYKNAWQTDDRAAVERYLKLAVEAARHAVVLDPDNAIARRHLGACQKRLDNLLSPPKSVDAPEHHAQSEMRN